VQDNGLMYEGPPLTGARSEAIRDFDRLFIALCFYMESRDVEGVRRAWGHLKEAEKKIALQYFSIREELPAKGCS
jgi:hypothetical protein